jgi:hypothetical protein
VVSGGLPEVWCLNQDYPRDTHLYIAAVAGSVTYTISFYG